MNQPLRKRLEFLDGVRGLAALYVLFLHAVSLVLEDRTLPSLSRIEQRMLAFCRYGSAAVVVFIVLSGFCLMLPMVNSETGKPGGGWKGYFIRRAQRILPPYYMALFASLALIAVTPGLRTSSGIRWDSGGLTPVPIVTHLLLVHDFFINSFTAIDPPMWSVAVEWHIYLFFPLLLFVWKRAGIPACVIVAAGLGYVPHRLSQGALDFAHFHFLGLFAIGMAACWVSNSNEPFAARLRVVRWDLLAAALSLLSLYTVVHNMGSLSRVGGMDYVPGCAAAALLIWGSAVSRLDPERRSFLLRALEYGALVKAGQFSYSLYLIHYPLLAAVCIGVRAIPSPDVRLLILCLFACPVIIGLSYLFHLAFERPFINNKRWMRTGSQEPAAVTP